MLRCVMPCERIIGPYFFENQNRAIAAVEKCIQTFLMPKVNGINFNMWFQQEGATAQKARESIQLLKTLIPNRLISFFGHVFWGPRSLDLIPLDFLWQGYLQEKVYVNRPNNFEDLKASSSREIRSNSPDLLRIAMNHWTKRMCTCVDGNGNHFKGVLF